MFSKAEGKSIILCHNNMPQTVQPDKNLTEMITLRVHGAQTKCMQDVC